MNQASLLIYIISIIASISLVFTCFRSRFLPVARPLMLLGFYFLLSSIMNFYRILQIENNLWISQFIMDLEFLLRTLFIPLWAWLLMEYQCECKVKVSNKIILMLTIHPLIILSLSMADIFNNGFFNQDYFSILVSPIERIGAYANFREIYGIFLSITLIFITIYLIIKKQQSSLLGKVQVVIYTFSPFIFFALYSFKITEYRLAGPAFILYFYWINYQYRLLDIMPTALDNIIDKINSGILVVNQKLKLVYINDHARNMLDFFSESENMQSNNNIKTPDIIMKNFDFLAENKQMVQIIIEEHSSIYSRQYIDAVLQPIFHPKLKQCIGHTIVLHNITRRKQAELKLKNLDQRKSRFFAGISHEFRTPLTLISGNISDVLSNIEKVSTKELKRSLTQVENNNQRLLHLVNQLLELSQLDAGHLKISPVQLYLDTYIPSIIANFEYLAKKQNCRIHFLLDQSIKKDTMLYLDLNAFDKIIINLISNALKSMPSGGDIYLQLYSVDEQHLHLSVRDNGFGMSADTLDKIFEMFYSFENISSTWSQGTGIGLSLVKQLLDLHGAEISVASIEEQGTTFTIIFCKGYQHFTDDVVVQHQSSTACNPSVDSNNFNHYEYESSETTVISENFMQHHSQNSTEKLILLVEDNAEMRLYIRKHLTMDFRIIEAADGEEALLLAQQTLPDLVLSDVMMPKMDGYELCKQLKGNLQTSHIPVLLLTAKSSQKEKLIGLTLGADDYLGKPFNVKELNIRMQNLIISRNRIKEAYQNKGLQKVIESTTLPKCETEFLDKLHQHIQNNISKTDIKVADLAAIVHMSERSLSRKLKALTGETGKNMILLIRLEHAAELLRSTTDPITKLSYSTGFTDASHFSRTFKAHFSMTPTQYRKNWRTARIDKLQVS